MPSRFVVCSKRQALDRAKIRLVCPRAWNKNALNISPAMRKERFGVNFIFGSLLRCKTGSYVIGSPQGKPGPTVFCCPLLEATLLLSHEKPVLGSSIFDGILNRFGCLRCRRTA